jgi:hypothetical protein
VQVRRGEIVRSVTPNGNHLDIRMRGGSGIQANTVFLATGKHDLHAPKRRVDENDDLIGFKTYFALSSAQQRNLKEQLRSFCSRADMRVCSPSKVGWRTFAS